MKRHGNSTQIFSSLVIALVLLAPSFLFANAVAVTNVSVSSAGLDSADIEFDLSWENSWHLTWSDDEGATSITSWDAAWVFVKFQTTGGDWRHAWLSESGHTACAGSEIEVASNGGVTNVGVIVRRDSTGSGAFSCPNMRLRWNFALNGLGGTNNVNISVHAIEMVYVADGAFSLGSGGAEHGHFYRSPVSSDSYTISGEGLVPVGSNTGELRANDIYTDIPAAFPKGYASFYCMKYEVSQGQYASFLNHLGPAMASVRYPDFDGSSRYTIALQSQIYSAAAQDRACNYLNIADVAAYLDWAGLRPMTELEFEKACRGTLPPEPNEYAWGNTTIFQLTAFTGNDGTGDETALPEESNGNYDRDNWGPVRVGIFAEPGSSRQEAGASYYGAMELTGNVSEPTVTAKTAGLVFAGTHGDGSLVTTPADWPGFDGYVRRGGDWSTDTDLNHGLHVSGRLGAASSVRNSKYGCRGVRTAP